MFGSKLISRKCLTISFVNMLAICKHVSSYKKTGWDFRSAEDNCLQVAGLLEQNETIFFESSSLKYDNGAL